MASLVTFTDPGGADPVAHILNIQTALVPTVGDGLYAGQLQRSRILERTAQGVDVDGIGFIPYSQNHPYYFYPNRGMGASPRGRAVAAARRHKKTGGAGKRTTLGIRYESYAAAKAALGRAAVDLFGLEQHTHMLNTLLVKVGGTELAVGMGQAAPGAADNPQPADEIRLGFYGPEADRAKGNNEGTSKLPRRHFFDANQQDIDMMAEAIRGRMLTRARAGK